MRYSTLLPTLLAIGSTLARPAQPEIANTTTLPTHFGLLTFPHFQALDIFGPMDLLNSLFMYYRNTSIVPQFTVFSKTMDPVTSAMTDGGFGQEIMPAMTFSEYLVSCDHYVDKNKTDWTKNKQKDHGDDDIPSADDKGAIDVLIVPGGGGTRRDMTEEINFVKATYPNGNHE
ncbi:uncharacterized protein J4E79_002656 [Alternaria viburni]|uniref:uncharacterized protein n=1 Tax=Alternaria viburni TaxID=566460 RepID=UPI0020C3A685|nr:uncharacterized protein J4E79_002656 [Alternaria viburni]KAI4666617.1 hypothetical protein J4E79_002656 [Alternaria viburni]